MAQQVPITAYRADVRNLGYECTNVFRLLLISLRPHQWVKNLFVLAPLLFAMKLGDPGSVVRAVSAFLVFCVSSAAMYLINDVVDVEYDRTHPQKRFRPIASRALSVRVALVSAFVLLTAALAGALAALGLKFTLVVIGYWVMTIGYCLAFKHALVLDGMLIAAGFVLRVVGGAVAITVAPTHWLIVCAFLLALFLAFAKRRQELLALGKTAGQHRFVLGQYTVNFLDHANNVVAGATIVCYALYSVAPDTIARFGTDTLIYGTGFVIYGLLRYMALLSNPNNGVSPSRMLVEDKPLLLALIGWAVYNTLIIYRSHLGL